MDRQEAMINMELSRVDRLNLLDTVPRPVIMAIVAPCPVARWVAHLQEDPKSQKWMVPDKPMK
jgi:hypothetical protein